MFFVMINVGVCDRPCAIVAFAVLLPTYFTIEKPALGLAETTESIVPVVNVDALPPAFQFHATKVPLFSLYPPAVPKEKPEELKAVTPVDSVISALALLDSRAGPPAPLTESTNLCEYAKLLAFTHVKSLWNPTSIFLAVALPV